jgi:probable phosphoglycerate mutase
MDWSFVEVLLARHGETEWNVVDRRQGRLDSPLTDRGRGHAESVATIADGRGGNRPDGLFVSPLGRARATAEVSAERLDLPLRVIDDLAEIDHGEMSGLTSPEIERRWPGALAERSANKYNWRFPGGESYADAAARAETALNTIAATGSIRPLIVCHEMISRLLVQCLLGLAPADGLSRSLPQGTVVSVEPAGLAASTD